MAQKLNAVDFDIMLNKVELILRSLQEKLDLHDFHQHQEAVAKKIIEIDQELGLKAYSKQVQVELSEK